LSGIPLTRGPAETAAQRTNWRTSSSAMSRADVHDAEERIGDPHKDEREEQANWFTGASPLPRDALLDIRCRGMSNE